jgi:hypothetical protein
MNLVLCGEGQGLFILKDIPRIVPLGDKEALVSVTAQLTR